MSGNLEKTIAEKSELRRIASSRRKTVQNADLLSKSIWNKLCSLEEFSAAESVMTYLDFNGEVKTRDYLTVLWNMGKSVVVPYCTANELCLFLLKSMDELACGKWGILEPPPNMRNLPQRIVHAVELDVIIVPGVAFDRNRHRLGLGKGYYDRFLQTIRPDAMKIALAFECQLFDRIPHLEHDVKMDLIITENALYSSDD
jgi:5-formyltetrahydrofolate cyclo-ligase